MNLSVIKLLSWQLLDKINFTGNLRAGGVETRQGGLNSKYRLLFLKTGLGDVWRGGWEGQ